MRSEMHFKGTVGSITGHVMAIILAELIVLLLGAILFASTTFENATYMATVSSLHPSIGPKFGAKLTLVKIETLTTPQPICTFSSGDSGNVPISRGGIAQQVGSYLVEVEECDQARGFVVIYAKQTTAFYRAMEKIWSVLGLK